MRATNPLRFLREEKDIFIQYASHFTILFGFARNTP